MTRNIEFPSEQAVLRGRLYLPDNAAGPLPAVIMAHGTSATVTMVTDRYAEVLCAAGFAVLLYDHRNFGLSGGEPRQEINPWVQARGYRDAVSYAQQIAEIDPHRIAIWGDSYSAAEVIVVAAVDERVKAVVAQIPTCGASLPAPDPDGGQFAMIRDTLLNGDVSGTPETTAGPMPVVSWDQVRHPSLLNPLTAFRWFIEHGGRHGSGWVNDVTRVSPPTPAPFNSVICAPHVQAPTLMLVAPEDEMVQCNYAVAQEAYHRLAGPKQWHDIAGGHFGLLWYPSDLFDEASGVQRAFLAAHLM